MGRPVERRLLRLLQEVQAWPPASPRSAGVLSSHTPVTPCHKQPVTDRCLAACPERESASPFRSGAPRPSGGDGQDSERAGATSSFPRDGRRRAMGRDKRVSHPAGLCCGGRAFAVRRRRHRSHSRTKASPAVRVLARSACWGDPAADAARVAIARILARGVSVSTARTRSSGP